MGTSVKPAQQNADIDVYKAVTKEGSDAGSNENGITSKTVPKPVIKTTYKANIKGLLRDDKPFLIIFNIIAIRHVQFKKKASALIKHGKMCIRDRYRPPL